MCNSSPERASQFSGPGSIPGQLALKTCNRFSLVRVESLGERIRKLHARSCTDITCRLTQYSLGRMMPGWWRVLLFLRTL